jgi:hypothetical protein
MTPLTVKEVVDSSLVGGVEYKGTFNATTGLTSSGGTLAAAEKGDMYVIDTIGTIYGQTWAVGDHLLINEDMGGSITNSKIDKVDNTDQVTSVNSLTGAVVLSGDDLAADHSATHYTAANANVDGHFSGVDTALGTKLSDITGESLDDLSDVSYTAGAGIDNYVLTYDHSSTSWGAEAVPSAPVTSVNSNTGAVVISGNDVVADHTATNYTAPNPQVDGHFSGVDTALGTKLSDITGESLDDLSDVSYTAGAGIDNYVLTYDHSSTSWGAEAVPSAPVTSVNSLTGAVTISGDDVAADHTASNYTAANANVDGHFSGVDTALGNKQPLDAGLTSISGLTTAADKMIYTTASDTYAVADLTSAGRALLDDADAAAQRTTLGLGTAATSASSDFLASTAGLDDLSDVSFTAGAGIDNYVLTYDHSTTSWGAEAAASGGLSAVVDDTTPQLGGALDVNGNSITSASDADVTIDPNGTGDIVVGADVLPAADATHTLGSESSRFVTLHSELNGAVQFKARNESGGPLTKGQAVYISGVSGTVPLISLARANSASTMPAFGLLAADVNNNADVQVITFGNLTDYNTTTYSLSANDTVFVSAATAGALTNSAPTGESNLIQNIGRVVRADASAGIIKVGGAGRSNATPNLDNNKIFVGNGSNQAVSTALSAINVGSFNDDGTYLNDVIDDTTPQLGGDLDVNANEIISASNNNVVIRPNGTGVVKLGGNTNPAEVRFYCESGDAHYVGLKSPAHASLSGSQTWTLPTADGTSGQVIKTDGSGVLSFVDQASGGGGWTYSAITADPANAQAGYHYSCTGTFTVTLPTSGVSAGEEIRVKNMGTGTITIDPQTQNIDGSTTDYVMDVQYSAITLVSTGTHWEVI